jgi:hypothetical protein
MASIAGAGNPVGSGGAGTGTSINYLGNHAYAYSGILQVTNVTKTMIDATTGNQYIVAKFQPSINVSTTDDMFFRVLIDGEEIAASLIGSTTSNSPYEEIELIVAPFTRIQITCANNSTSGGINCSAVLTGRVYA